MTDTLTQSFCERCGTRYTLTEPQEAKPEESRGKRGLFGRKAAEPADEPSGPTASPSSDSLAGTFHFCLDCRQYTCSNCWNVEAGACQSCHPPGEATQPAGGGQARVVKPATEPTAWPSGDVARSASAPATTPAASPVSTSGTAGAADGKDPWTGAPRKDVAETTASSDGDDTATELDEWGRPRPKQVAQAAAPEEVAVAPESVVDPWRGVVFSADESASDAPEMPPSSSAQAPVAPIASAGASAPATPAALDTPSPAIEPAPLAAWPQTDHATPEPEPDAEEDSLDPDDGQAEQDQAALEAIGRLNELRSQADAGSWASASAATVAANEATKSKVDSGPPSVAVEPQAPEPAQDLLDAPETEATDDTAAPAVGSDADDAPRNQAESPDLVAESTAAAVPAASEAPLAAAGPEPIVEVEPAPGAPADVAPAAMVEPPAPPDDAPPEPVAPAAMVEPPAPPDDAPPEPVAPAAMVEPPAPLFSFAEPEPPPAAIPEPEPASTPEAPAQAPAPEVVATPSPIAPIPTPPAGVDAWAVDADQAPFGQPFTAPSTQPAPMATPPPAPPPTMAAPAPVGADQQPAPPPPTPPAAVVQPMAQSVQPPPGMAASAQPQQPYVPQQPAQAAFLPPPAPPTQPPHRPVPVPRANTRECPNCTLPLSAKARFCRRCGTPQA